MIAMFSCFIYSYLLLVNRLSFGNDSPLSQVGTSRGNGNAHERPSIPAKAPIFPLIFKSCLPARFHSVASPRTLPQFPQLSKEIKKTAIADHSLLTSTAKVSACIV